MEKRQIARDSLFVMADMRLAGSTAVHRIKVRNLSSGGLMAEGGPQVVSGTGVSIDLRNIGWIDGTVAWVQDNRCGIAFVEEIDPKAVRGPASAGNGQPEFYRRRPIAAVMHEQAPNPERLRKV